MTSAYLKNLAIYKALKTVSFERFYRNRALNIECKEDITNRFIKELCENGFISIDDINIEAFHNQPFSIFEDEESWYLLWLTQCIRFRGKSLLSELNGYIEKVSMVQRGGINSYKRNGWDVHILYVYQLVNYNFANNIVPKALLFDFDVKSVFNKFHNEYLKLSKTAWLVLKFGCFLHDIGIQIAVNDHEKLGVSLLGEAYKQLEVESSIYCHPNIYLNEDEMIEVLKVLVGYHQLINQVAAEVSDYVIYSDIKEIEEKLSTNNTKLFFKSEFSRVMFLLGAADMIAVDDSLLSEIKFNEILEAKEYIQSIIDGNTFIRDYEKYGIRRLKCFMNDSLKKISDKIIKDTIQANGCSEKDVLQFMYEVRGVSYGVAAIKPLNDVNATVLFVCILYSIVSQYTNDFKNVSIKIDASFDKDYIKCFLSNTPTDCIRMIKYDTFENAGQFHFVIYLNP